MQQTNKYQFNLIESGDTFSAAPLNENMEKVEAALGIGGLNARVAYGSYTGTGTHGSSNPTVVTVDFKPLVLMVTSTRNEDSILFVYGCPTGECHNTKTTVDVAWTENSVSWYHSTGASYQFNSTTTLYSWVALGINE